MSGKISAIVITPTISARKSFLKKCQESVRSQTITVNHLVIEDNLQLGAPKIRNEAVKNTNAEWVIFLDDDDWLHPTFIEELLPHLESADVIFSWPDFWPGPRPFWLWDHFDPKVLDSWCPWSQCAAVRRSFYLKVGGQPESGVIYEDWSLWLRLRDGGARFTTIPKVLWTHRIHANQRTLLDRKNLNKVSH